MVITSGHPSPLSANRGFWFGNKHFSQCNDYLKGRGVTRNSMGIKEPKLSLKFLTTNLFDAMPHFCKYNY
jgi:hypothetical protein